MDILQRHRDSVPQIEARNGGKESGGVIGTLPIFQLSFNSITLHKGNVARDDCSQIVRKRCEKSRHIFRDSPAPRIQRKSDANCRGRMARSCRTAIDRDGSVNSSLRAYRFREWEPAESSINRQYS